MTGLFENREDTGSLAGAALMRGIFALGRSFRFHRPRGAFCHRGWCQQCKVRLSDGRNVLACQTSASDLALMVRPRFYLRLLGRFAEAFPPWFHETCLLRPRFMRQVYLRTLRHLSGALPLPVLPAPPEAKTWTEEKCQTLVIGGGLAGMKAATLLARAGRSVMLVEASALGGDSRSAPTYRALRAEFDACQIRLEEQTTCVGLYDDAQRATCVGPRGVAIVQFDELVVATGAYDRLPAFVGNDLPGIVGLRGFEKLLRAGHVPVGLKIGLFVAADHLERALDTLTASGRSPAWVASPEMIAIGPGTTSLSNARIARAHGGKKISAVAFENGRRIACDLLVLGFSQPSYELQLQAGQTVTLAPNAGGLSISGDAAVPLLVVGEAAGAVTVAEAVAQTERAIEAWLASREPIAAPVASAAACVSRDDGAFLCVCEDVRVGDVRRAIADGFADVDLIKRRTGAGTGPCQGKLCHPELARCLAESGVKVQLPTIRPLLRPTRLSDFYGAGPA